MYVKIFKSKDDKESYTILYEPNWERVEKGHYFLENEKHERIAIDERVLFEVLDECFKGLQNAI